jgi:hypothetical protein
MGTTLNHPVGLRLTGGDDAALLGTNAPRADPRIQVALENFAAAQLSIDDARWALAARTAESLEGGRAAVLPPQKRERLTRLATSLGMRPFDANLVIAIVQDGARSGEGPLGHGVTERLQLVQPPQPRRGAFGGPSGWLMLVTLGMAAGIMLLLIEWIHA